MPPAHQSRSVAWRRAVRKACCVAGCHAARAMQASTRSSAPQTIPIQGSARVTHSTRVRTALPGGHNQTVTITYSAAVSELGAPTRAGGLPQADDGDHAPEEPWSFPAAGRATRREIPTASHKSKGEGHGTRHRRPPSPPPCSSEHNTVKT